MRHVKKMASLTLQDLQEMWQDIQAKTATAICYWEQYIRMKDQNMERESTRNLLLRLCKEILKDIDAFVLRDGHLFPSLTPVVSDVIFFLGELKKE